MCLRADEAIVHPPLVAGAQTMNYQLSITPKPGYVHAIITGRNSREAVEGYLAQLFQECAARRHVRILIEERLEGPRLGTIEVFDIASKGGQQSATPLQAIAYVDVNAEGDLMQFAENVAQNRGLPVSVFTTVRAAETWLQQQAMPDAR
jgi:hypothetical protein